MSEEVAADARYLGTVALVVPSPRILVGWPSMVNRSLMLMSVVMMLERL